VFLKYKVFYRLCCLFFSICLAQNQQTPEGDSDSTEQTQQQVRCYWDHNCHVVLFNASTCIHLF